MRRVVGSCVLGLWSAVAFAGAGAPEAVPAAPAAPAVAPDPDAPAPRIKFDAVSVELGEIVRGEDAVATFAYHNTGNAPLHILGAKPG
jgi:hypothetical protein